MRIALLTDLYPPYIGGQPNRFRELATRLAARGHEVSVHCVATDAGSPMDAIEDGVVVRRWPRDIRFDRPLVPATKRGVRSTIRYARSVRRALRAEPVDVAYFNQWPYLHVLLAPGQTRRHAGIDWCELRQGVAYAAVQRVLPRMVAFNLCVNDQLALELSASSGRSVGYLPSGVDVGRCWSAPAEQRSGLLFLGRLVDTKDLPLLIAGFAELCRRGHDQRLCIAGDGELAPLVRELVAGLPHGIGGRVDVVGTVTEDDKARLLASSQVLVLPSKREGFPVVVAEAMASGLPVATVDRVENGTSHVVRRYGIGATGPPTATGVADAVEAVLADWACLSQRGLRAAVDLHWDRIVDQFLERVDALRTPG